jgi:hypothetical protein
MGARMQRLEELGYFADTPAPERFEARAQLL